MLSKAEQGLFPPQIHSYARKRLIGIRESLHPHVPSPLIRPRNLKAGDKQPGGGGGSSSSSGLGVGSSHQLFFPFLPTPLTTEAT